MSVIDEVRQEREDLARVLKKHAGIRRIVEDLYPDSAHFIYELLQNAEDANATEACFTLKRAGLVFEHDGRPFEIRDIYAITDIGEGTKADDDDKIGRFGVGFKAVFAYSETPHIWSPTFSFRITDLVLPNALEQVRNLGNRTRFEFPFDNPKKAANIAFSEVAKGLSELAETTLLFLSHLKSVSWQVGGGASGKVLRVQHSENHIEVLKQGAVKTTDRSHFLKFDRPVEGLEKQRVAVAFALDFLPGVQSFDPVKTLVKQVKIIPAVPGRVAVFFPAEKEASGLRFHLHAPFVPELSRASIKETPANLPLFEQLARLTAESLYRVRDLGLLTTEFLEVLPNGRDQVDGRYAVIRSAIIHEMNDHPLTPTQSKLHAPARHLLQGKASLKSLLSDEDLGFLIHYDEPPHWAAGAAQKHSNADRFLDGLATKTWDVDDFVELLCNNTGTQNHSGLPEAISPDDVIGWLRGKSIAWHQELYALLLTDHLMVAGWRRKEFAAQLASLLIVRLTDGGYGVGRESFFVSDGVEHDEVLRRVDERVYSTGRGKPLQKANAKAFLEEIGVREVGQAELVEAILKRRYTHEAEIPDERTYRHDLNRFVELVEADPSKASLFADYYIFQGVDLWRTPCDVFLDQPFLDTGLNAYYGALRDEADRAALNDSYQNRGIGAKRLAKFALAVGAAGTLEIQQTSCTGNPKVKQLVWAARGNRTSSRVDLDYHIPRLDCLLKSPAEALSLLVWRTLSNQQDESWTTAKYRNNSSYLSCGSLVFGVVFEKGGGE